MAETIERARPQHELPARLHAEIDALIGAVEAEGLLQSTLWRERVEREPFRASAENLACYLAARRRDLRRLQQRLMICGLSSLGRMESRVLPTLKAVRGALAALAGQAAPTRPSAREMLAGEHRLARARREIFGPLATPPLALMVTCPTEAATDPSFMLELARRKVTAVRINCAHDDAASWRAMIDNLRAAEAATGFRMRVFMDLAGPKIRSGAARLPGEGVRIAAGDVLALARPGELDQVTLLERHFAVECSLAEALAASDPGDRIFIDDGKLQAAVDRVEPWGVRAVVTHAPPEGLKLKPERGLNFPDAALGVAALTDKDRKDLGFIAANADGVEFSFVQSAADVVALQDALAAVTPDWPRLALILKVERAKAVANLPEMIVRAAGQQPTAVMIARGDLAVEIGFARTAEIQEEILWLAEAASVPVIWATQVMERLIKKGVPSRGEMTDAAMAARAECVMLNKGPFLLEAIDQLQALAGRMSAHQHKKSARLRRLRSWPPLP